MQAILLAGGLGTRLRSVVSDPPEAYGPDRREAIYGVCGA